MASYLNFYDDKKEMIIAKKDDLEIEVTVVGEKVNIEMPAMQDILFLWEGWIKQEELLAERHLKMQDTTNKYGVLANYLADNGWEIKEIKFSQS